MKWQPEKETSSQGRKRDQVLDIAMPEASRPGIFRSCEPIKILFGLSWLQVSFSHTNTIIVPIARDSGPKFYLAVT